MTTGDKISLAALVISIMGAAYSVGVKVTGLESLERDVGRHEPLSGLHLELDTLHKTLQAELDAHKRELTALADRADALQRRCDTLVSQQQLDDTFFALYQRHVTLALDVKAHGQHFDPAGQQFQGREEGYVLIGGGFDVDAQQISAVKPLMADGNEAWSSITGWRMDSNGGGNHWLYAIEARVVAAPAN